MPSEEDLKYLRTITRDEKESTKLDVKPIMAIAQPVSRGKQVDVLLMQYLGSYHNPLNVEQVDNILATEYERGPSNEEIAELIRLLNKKDPEESDQVMNRYLHIQQCLLHFPVNVPITKNSFGLVKTCPMPWIKR